MSQDNPGRRDLEALGELAKQGAEQIIGSSSSTIDDPRAELEELADHVGHLSDLVAVLEWDLDGEDPPVRAQLNASAVAEEAKEVKRRANRLIMALRNG